MFTCRYDLGLIISFEMTGDCLVLFIIIRPNMLARKRKSCLYLSQSFSVSLHTFFEGNCVKQEDLVGQEVEKACTETKQYWSLHTILGVH